MLRPERVKKSVRRGAVFRSPRIVPRGAATRRSRRCAGRTAPAIDVVPSSSVERPVRTTIRARSVCERVSTAPTVSAAGAPPGPAMSP
jgi:hypothetical protein